MCKLGIKFQAKKVEVQLTNPNDYLIDPPDLHVNHHTQLQVHDHVSQQTQLGCLLLHIVQGEQPRHLPVMVSPGQKFAIL